MRWKLVVPIAAVLVLSAGAWIWFHGVQAVRAPIRLGLLHSSTGPLAISEGAMVDAEQLAVDEINERGGLLGRRVEIVPADGQSRPEVFGHEAERLLRDEKVDALIGCWTSSCRKAVVPLVERYRGLLIYPVAYEGLETSPNVVYTGAAPNQQVIPAVQWSLQVLKAKKFYLIGSEGIWARSANAIIKDQFKALGGEVVGEAYLPDGTSDVTDALAKIVAAHPDLVIATVEGATNVPFYRALRQPGAASAQLPSMSFTITEEELRELPRELMTRDYIVCNYFQSIDRAENRDFVARFKARYGSERVTSDAVATAYSSVHLWARAVEEAESSVAREVIPALLRQSLNAPEGIISVDRETQQTYRPFFVAKVRADGQADIILALDKPIRPVPYPFSRTRDEWAAFTLGLAGAGTAGTSSSPSR